MRKIVVGPETWYVIFWLAWPIVVGALCIVAARIWLVNPILRALNK